MHLSGHSTVLRTKSCSNCDASVISVSGYVRKTATAAHEWQLWAEMDHIRPSGISFHPAEFLRRYDFNPRLAAELVNQEVTARIFGRRRAAVIRAQKSALF